MNQTGCLLRPTNTRNYTFGGTGGKATDLPDSYILPDEMIPTVRDQGDTNSCVGHGIAEVMGVMYGREFGEEKIISPWYIYGNAECRNGYTGLGMYLDDAVDGVRKCGSVPLTDFDVRQEPPYVIDAVAARPELKDRALPYKIKSYMEIPKYAMDSKHIQALKEALYTYQTPIVIASQRYFSGGGHCVILIGYTSNDDFIFLNSWGDTYGDHGRGTIPAKYVDEAYMLFDEIMPVPFTDVQSDQWYYNDVKTAYFSGVINGVTENTFEPDTLITRAEAAVIALRVIQKTQQSIDAYSASQNRYVANVLPKGKVESVDVPTSAWYHDDVAQLLSSGIMKGDAEGTFRPEEHITRAETAAVAVRLLDYIANALGTHMPKQGGSIQFVDVYANDWFFEVVYSAAKYGLIGGDPEGTFRPNDNITRAEFASIIVRDMKQTDEMFLSLCEM